MGRLSVKTVEQDGQTVFRLGGNMVEGSGETLRSATKAAGVVCTFNWSGVTITSSAGIREWVYFLADFGAGRTLAFAECPPNIVNSFNMIPGCLGTAKVVSAFGTFACPLCNRERQELLQLATDVAADGVVLRAVECDGCGSEMRLNLPDQEYFGFLSW
jgi:hypothetical protein